MKSILKYYVVLLILLVGCTDSVNYQDDDSDAENSNHTEQYADDTYCAEVDYYNPRTGTSSTYTLTVEVEDNEITAINWPNGGRLDSDHFSGAEIDENGSANFTTDRGNEYDVHITSEGGDCFTSVPVATRCMGITKKGTRCKNLTDNPNGLCWKHQDQDEN